MMHEQITVGSRKQGGRPFPWRCPNCLEDAVKPERMPYTCDVAHDGRTYQIEIHEIDIPKCQACGNLVITNSVDDQIIQALREHIELLTPEQIRSGREGLGLKSKELADKLGVAAETISRWERGGLIQSRAMDNFLRVFFAVPEAREVLRGSDQDPSLGTTVAAHIDPPMTPDTQPADSINEDGDSIMSQTSKKSRANLIIGTPRGKVQPGTINKSFDDTLRSGVGEGYAIPKKDHDRLRPGDKVVVVDQECNPKRRAEGTLVKLVKNGTTNHSPPRPRYHVYIKGLKEVVYKSVPPLSRGWGGLVI